MSERTLRFQQPSCDAVTGSSRWSTNSQHFKTIAVSQLRGFL